MITKTKPRSTNHRPAGPRAAVMLAVGLSIVVAFQAALTFGAPFGVAAQGGANPGQLPVALRLVAGVAAVAFLCAVLVVLARGGRALVPLPEAVSRVGAWGVVAFLGVGVLMNFASSSPWERFGWGPYTLIMFVLSVILARSGTVSDRPRRTGSTGRSTFPGTAS